MDTVETSILDNPKLATFSTLIQTSDSVVVEGLWDTPKALLISLALKELGRDIVILTGGSRESRLFDDFPFFGIDPIEFPAWETLPHENVPPSPDIVGERYRVLQELMHSDQPRVIVTTLQAVLQKLLPKEKLRTLYLPLRVEQELPFDELPDHLELMGYVRKSIAADKGEFAVRGSILDIFPVSSPDPIRIEFWDDVITSMRTYDPLAQTSVKKITDIILTPGEESALLENQNELATLFDYLKKPPLIVMDEIADLEDKYATLKGMMNRELPTFASFQELWNRLSTSPKLYFTYDPLDALSPIIRNGEKLGFEAFQMELEAQLWPSAFLTIRESFIPEGHEPVEFSPETLFESIEKTMPQVEFVCQNESEIEYVRKHLKDPTITKGYLSSGMYLGEPPTALIPMAELTGRLKVRRQKQRSHYHTLPVETLSLTPGEAVVHLHNGIGRFIGIEKRENHLGVQTEYMLLEYAEGARLFVPMDQAHMISKYIGVNETKPELHQLGSSRWKRAKEKTERAILTYAEDLLQLQAARAHTPGFAQPPDSDLVKQFAQEFPYNETPDQLIAIENIHADLCSDKSMERLVCGDVGYGKTEVSMRAAFKTVVDGGKQVAVLVPTTVLALQHYETFKERMRNFPVNVGVLSRFQKPKEIKQTLEKCSKGEIDILVGTHRIVSKDVLFKDLGLIIIDEEQRFGVRTKEHLKTLKQQVDSLTLSATPIPRTLYMSLIGARDLSVINTPPEDRLPIQSMITHTTDEIIKNALMRELARDGQAYVIHNRVETLFEFGDRIRKLVPHAKVVAAHGQMTADELDAIFHSFKTGKANILVATSIVENGIDIPNANTILIDRADRFGMADLYQMRGRVGRWNRKAYCYFMVHDPMALNPIAHKRLMALAASSGHGGGMKIAMHDLEIRGAGNILGTDQSGHVQTIGFHFYCKLLKKAVKRLKKKERSFLIDDVKLELPYDARLPEEYVNDVNLRMDLYQRLGDSETSEEVSSLEEEVTDRFGEPPLPAQWLYALTRIRIYCQYNAFSLVRFQKNILTADQSHGKKEKITRRSPFPHLSEPAEFEKTLYRALEELFPSPKRK